MASFPFATCVPFGRERAGVLFRAAAHEVPPEAVLQRLEALMGLAGVDALRYVDRRKGQRRVVRLQRKGQEAFLEAFLLAGDTSAQGWIKTLLVDELPAQAYGRQLLSPGAQPALAPVARGRQVCTCLNVSDAAINKQLASGFGGEDARLAALQSALKCGTNCGSCVPELRRMVRAAMPAAPSGQPAFAI